MSNLEKDYEYFVENFKAITKDHIGKFVVIFDCKIIGYYATQEAAIAEMRKLGKELGEYIVQKCTLNIEDNNAVYHSRVGI